MTSYMSLLCPMCSMRPIHDLRSGQVVVKKNIN